MYAIVMLGEQPPNVVTIRWVLKVVSFLANTNYWYSLGAESHSDSPERICHGRSGNARGL